MGSLHIVGSEDKYRRHGSWDLASVLARISRVGVLTRLLLIALAVLVVIGLWHGSLGLQVVIEDYITLGGGRNAALLVMRVAMASAGLASLWAVARIAL